MKLFGKSTVRKFSDGLCVYVGRKVLLYIGFQKLYACWREEDLQVISPPPEPPAHHLSAT